MPLHVENRLRLPNPAGGVALGLVRAEGVRTDAAPPGLASALAEIEAASGELGPRLEARRKAARDMLRNAPYRPTGRGKPASEYLLRAAAEAAFPRINAVVDAANLVSAQALLPVSLWDLERAAAERYVFRLGREGEAYVFNPAGQALELEGLVAGCRVRAGEEEPIVTPVKDAQATKTTPETRRVAACLYAPPSEVAPEALEALCEALAGWLARCGEDARAAWAVAQPGETATL